MLVTEITVPEQTYMHVTPLWHIILIPNQPVFALTPQFCMLSNEAVNTKVIVCGFHDPTGAVIHELLHWERARYPFHHRFSHLSTTFVIYYFLNN